MDYEQHKKFFERSYRTGSDIWTHLSMKNRGKILMEKLAPDSIILDVGSGRGFFAKKLVEFGYRVIGVDFESNVVQKANSQIKEWNLVGKLRFVEGDALDLPFVDNSFDGVCDFGLLENLYKEDWNKYAEEICRVLKPGGFYLNTSLSRETQSFLDFRPKGSKTGDLEKYGVYYHFFEKDEVKNIFDHQLNTIKQDIEFVEKPRQVALLETLFQKKKD